MKQNYIWINYEKGEYLNALDFDESSRIDGYLHNRGRCNNVLYTLMNEEWRNDHIILTGEELPEEKSNRIVIDLKEKFNNFDCLGNAWYGAQSLFRNAADPFLSEEPAKEIKYYRYVINPDKHEYYRRRSLKDRNVWFNPLTFLLVCSKEYSKGNYGKWIGDTVELSNDNGIVKDPEYRNMTSIYTYQYFLGGEDACR